MSDGSTYLRNAIVDDYFRTPATPFLALFDGPDAGDELADAGYVRQALTMAAPSDGDSENADPCVFGPFVGSGSVTHAAIADAVSGGNLLTQIVPLVVPVAYAAAATLVVDAGSILLDVD